mgnify:CR=1 FL=1
MKMKFLACAILGMLLSACNDSDDKLSITEPNEPSTLVTEYYTYDFATPSVDESEWDKVELLSESLLYRLQNGAFYKDNHTAVPVKYLFSVDEETPYTYITDKGIFEQDLNWVSNLGVKYQVLLAQTEQQWTVRPATVPESDIRNSYTLKWYDLSGQKMTTRTALGLQKIGADQELKNVIDPDQATFVKRQKWNQSIQNFLKLQQQRSFPQGAKCFQFVERKSAVDYVAFGYQVDFATLDEWQTDMLDERHAKSMMDGQIYNIKYKKAEYSDEEPSLSQYIGVLEYQNKIFEAEFSEDYKPQEGAKRFVGRVLKLFEMYPEEFEIYPDENTTLQALKLFEYNWMDQIAGCDGYNTIAAKAVDQLVNDAQVK